MQKAPAGDADVSSVQPTACLDVASSKFACAAPPASGFSAGLFAFLRAGGSQSDEGKANSVVDLQFERKDGETDDKPENSPKRTNCNS